MDPEPSAGRVGNVTGPGSGIIDFTSAATPTTSPPLGTSETGLSQASTNRIFVSEESSGRGLANDENLWRGQGVAGVEGTSSEQVGLIGLKVVRTDAVNDCGRLAARLGRARDRSTRYLRTSPQLKKGVKEEMLTEATPATGLEFFQSKAMEGRYLFGGHRS